MKKLIIILLLVSISLLSVSCSDKAPKTSDEELVIGILPAEGAIPIILAKELGFFDDVHLNVSITAFSSPNDRNVAIQSNAVDGAIGDIMTAASFVDRGLALKITSDISEDFKILSSPNSGVTSISELDGQSVSLVPNFILEYIMDVFADEAGITYEIVEIPSFSGRAEALMSDQIQGVIFTEPQAGMLVSQGAHLLASSKEAGITGGALLFTEDVIANRPSDLEAFYIAYNKAVDYMNDNPVASYSSILSDYNFPDAISAYLEGKTDTFNHANILSEEQFTNIIDWTVTKGQISKAYTYKELTDFSFIE